MVGKKHFRYMTGAVFLALCGSGIAAFAAGSSLSVTSRITTGVVDIQLTEYQMTDGKEVEYEDNQIILPGKKISKIPRISNIGNDCYVRAKIEVEGTEESIQVYGMDTSWIKCSDGYYYYDRILENGQETDLFRGVQIPEDFSQEEEGKDFQIQIDIDAIQSQNFFPDYSAEDPWGEVEILTCTEDGSYNITAMTQTGSRDFAVVYLGDSRKLITNTDDFFVNFPAVQPGDEYSDSLTLYNGVQEPMKLYFSTADAVLTQTEDESTAKELLEQIQLRITLGKDGRTEQIYSGALAGKELNNGILLGTFTEGESAELHFTIEVPEGLDNAYTLSDAAVQWIFSTEQIQTEQTAVKTGDVLPETVWPALTGLLLSGGVLATGMQCAAKRKGSK